MEYTIESILDENYYFSELQNNMSKMKTIINYINYTLNINSLKDKNLLTTDVISIIENDFSLNGNTLNKVSFENIIIDNIKKLIELIRTAFKNLINWLKSLFKNTEKKEDIVKDNIKKEEGWLSKQNDSSRISDMYIKIFSTKKIELPRLKTKKELDDLFERVEYLVDKLLKNDMSTYMDPKALNKDFDNVIEKLGFDFNPSGFDIDSNKRKTIQVNDLKDLGFNSYSEFLQYYKDCFKRKSLLNKKYYEILKLLENKQNLTVQTIEKNPKLQNHMDSIFENIHMWNMIFKNIIEYLNKSLLDYYKIIQIRKDYII